MENEKAKPGRKLITASAVSKLLGGAITERWLQLERVGGGIGRGPAYYKVGGKVVYDQSEVETWFSGQRVDVNQGGVEC